MSTTEATARTQHLFVTRGVIAIAWAAVFAAVSDSPTADVTLGAGALLVLYPLIDAAASLIDARRQHGSARRLLLAGSVSIVAFVVYLGAAAGDDPMLSLLVLYAATGGIEFVIQAWLLARRRRRATDPAAHVLTAS